MTQPTGQTPETQNAQAETEDQGSLDAAASAFAREDEPEATTEAPEAEPVEEPGDGEPEAEAEPEEELVEVEVGSTKLRLSAAEAEEVQKATLRQAEFSRKMNEVAAKEKAYTQKTEAAERLLEGVEKYATAKAEVTLIEARIKAFDKVDWQRIRAENPGEYAALAADFQNLRLSKSDAETRLQSIDGEINSTKSQKFAEERAEMDRVLQKELKGWGNEKGAALTSYAKELGVSEKTLFALTDPGLVKALDKAQAYDALQKGKTELKAKAKEAPPVLKPGAPARNPDKTVEAMAKLRKSNSMDDAAAAFLSRMR